MQTTVDTMDCGNFYEKNQHPMYFLPADKPDHLNKEVAARITTHSGVWWALDNVWQPDDEPHFNINDNVSEYIRIPMFSYRTTKTRMEPLLGMGAQLGAWAMTGLPVERVMRMHIVLGGVYAIPDESQYESWIGLAFQLQL